MGKTAVFMGFYTVSKVAWTVRDATLQHMVTECLGA